MRFGLLAVAAGLFGYALVGGGAWLVAFTAYGLALVFFLLVWEARSR